ncbi:MarR family winged helix-turn-helix transcriptional regulator [Streptomyces sp. NPDC000851]
MRGLHADTGYLLYRLGLHSGQLFNAFLQESGLRLRHYAVLRFLATSQGALQRELSERLGYDPSAIVGLVDDLEKLGFAERRPAPEDRRSRIVVLTEAGRAFLRDTDEAGLHVTNDLLEPLDPAERETLHALLLRITEPDSRS